MKIIKGNIWNYHKDNSFIIITTNGFVKNNGDCVMGRGIALEAKNKFPKLPQQLGSNIHAQGNVVFHFYEYNLITFPVKHNWWEDANLELINKSSKDLFDYYEEGINLGADLPKIYMPKPGCGNGKLLWKDVEPILDHWLSQLVTIVDYK